MTINHSEMKKLYLTYLDDDARPSYPAKYDLPIQELFARALRRIPNVLGFERFSENMKDYVKQLENADWLAAQPPKQDYIDATEPAQTAPTPGKCGKSIHGGKFCNRLPEHDKPSRDHAGKVVGATPCSTIPF